MEINNPLISIVMPLYNHYKYVDDAINSILNQTYNNIELIIVDDGSTDGSSTIALQAVIRDKRVKYVCQDNRGTGEALNSGYQLAKGKYGTWVSSDNVYYPQMLLTFYDFLQNNNSQFVFSAFDIYQNDKYYHTFKLGGINNACILNDFITRSFNTCITGICFLYSMDLKNKCGNFLDIPGEDYYMGVCMGFETNVGYIPISLGKYRRHDNFVSGRLEKNLSLHIKNGGISAVEMVKRLISLK